MEDWEKKNSKQGEHHQLNRRGSSGRGEGKKLFQRWQKTRQRCNLDVSPFRLRIGVIAGLGEKGQTPLWNQLWSAAGKTQLLGNGGILFLLFSPLFSFPFFLLNSLARWLSPFMLSPQPFACANASRKKNRERGKDEGSTYLARRHITEQPMAASKGKGGGGGGGVWRRRNQGGGGTERERERDCAVKRLKTICQIDKFISNE